MLNYARVTANDSIVYRFEEMWEKLQIEVVELFETEYQTWGFF